MATKGMRVLPLCEQEMTSKYPSVTIRIDQDLLEAVDRYAQLSNQSRSQYIKDAIIHALEVDQELNPTN